MLSKWIDDVPTAEPICMSNLTCKLNSHKNQVRDEPEYQPDDHLLTIAAHECVEIERDVHQRNHDNEDDEEPKPIRASLGICAPENTG